MELPLHEQCYDVSKTEGASDLHYSSFSPNASNIFVTGFSCRFSSCPAKPCDPAVVLTLQGHNHFLSTPNHTWYFWCASGVDACGSFLLLLHGRAVLPGAALQFHVLARRSCSAAVTVPLFPLRRCSSYCVRWQQLFAEKVKIWDEPFAVNKVQPMPAPTEFPNMLP